MSKSRQTKNQKLYQKQIERVRRSMQRYAKQGYIFRELNDYFPTPKRITQSVLKNLQSFKGKKIRDLGVKDTKEYQDFVNEVENPAQETYIESTPETENIANYGDISRIQIENLYAELDNFPAEIKTFLVQQFEDIMYRAGLNAINENEYNVDTNDIQAVKEVGKIYISSVLQDNTSLIYYIQNSGYDSYQAIREYCSDIVNKLEDIGVLGASEKDELDDMFEMQLGFYETMSRQRKASRKAERQRINREIKKIREQGVKYKNGKAIYSPQYFAERTKKLQQMETEKINKMSNEEFAKWARGYK